MGGLGGAAGFTRAVAAHLDPPDRLLATLRTADRAEYRDRLDFGGVRTMSLCSPVVISVRWRTTSATTTRYSLLA